MELECPTCQDLMGDLCELKSKYAGQVEELDGLKAKCGELQLELDKPALSEELECESCPHLAVDIAELQRKLRARPALLGACLVYPTLKGELEQLRADFETLGAPSHTCENCLTLRMLVMDKDAIIKRLEKATPVIPSLDCDTCAAQTLVLEDLREEVLSLQDDNNRLREVLSWVYARQPQLEMIIESTKRAEGDTSGFGFGEGSSSGVKKSTPVKLKTASPQPFQTADGVYHEPSKAAPKKKFGTPKPSKAKLDRIVKEVLKPKGKETIQQPVAPTTTPPPPRPKAQPNPPRRPTYHCEFCQRSGHLEEFCFRRKQVERQERAWGD